MSGFARVLGGGKRSIGELAVGMVERLSSDAFKAGSATIRLPPLIELKLAAGRSQDLADVIKLIQTNPEQIGAIRQHLAQVHADYASQFDRLVQQAHEEAEDASVRSTESGA